MTTAAVIPVPPAGPQAVASVLTEDAETSPETAVDISKLGPDDEPPADMHLPEYIHDRWTEKPVGTKQVLLANWLKDLITPFVMSKNLGSVCLEASLRLRPDEKYFPRPDLVFVPWSRWAEPPDRGEGWPVVPQLVVEIISPTNTVEEIDRKIDEYFAAGVSAVWEVRSAAKRIHIYSSPTSVRILKEGDAIGDIPGLPGLTLTVAEIFAGPRRPT
jgi:Uma2 family endonuclease